MPASAVRARATCLPLLSSEPPGVMSDDFLLLGFIGAVVCAIAGATILSEVERTFTGLLLGFFFGPLGFVIAWAMRANRLNEEERRRRQHVQAPAVMRQISAVEELEKLAVLRERGHITEEEFARAKAQILGGAQRAPTQPFR